MYINSKVCFSCSHEEKKNFPSNSKLFSYFVDISFSSAAIQANKNAQSEYFPNLYPGRVSSTFLPPPCFLSSVLSILAWLTMHRTQIEDCFSRSSDVFAFSHPYSFISWHLWPKTKICQTADTPEWRGGIACEQKVSPNTLHSQLS